MIAHQKLIKDQMEKEDILKMYPDAKFILQKSKRRYFYFLGNKTEKKYYKSKIEEYIKEYPKRS